MGVVMGVVFQVADHAIEVLEGVASEPGAVTERNKTNGLKTVNYFFEMGVSYLKKYVNH